MSVAASSGTRSSRARSADGALPPSVPGGRQRSLTDEPPFAPAPDPDLTVANLDLEVHAGQRIDRLVGQPRPAVVRQRFHRLALDEELPVAEAELPISSPRREEVVRDQHDRHAEL